MKRIVVWYNRLSNLYKILFSCIGITVPFYFSAYFGFYLSENQNLSKTWSFLFQATVFIVMTTLFVFIIKIFQYYQEKIKKEYESEKQTLNQAYTFCDRILTHRLKYIRELGSNPKEFSNILITSLNDIQEVVSAAYQTFESAYGQVKDNNERIDFEVTFMTKSYSDGEIIIPASANRDGRSPTSMLLRNTNPKIYQDSVTAVVYQEEKPIIKIIEDTSDPNNKYNSLYSQQLERIKSSIIYPVLSDLNELLGTLVIHCDEKYFFKNKKKKFWAELFEIFVKRIAIEKTKMDILQKLISLNNDNIQILRSKPF